MGFARQGAVIVLFIPLALLGCGDGSGNERFSRPEEAQLNQAQRAVQAYCRRLELYLAHKRSAPTSADLERPIEALDRVVALARAKPDAKSKDDERASEILGDIAEDLEGSNCSPDLETEIDQALRTLPSG